MVWAYRVLLSLAGGIIGSVLLALPTHQFLVSKVGLDDDAPFWIFLGFGCCFGLLVATLTYRQAWFHWACIVLGSLAAALCVWKFQTFFEASNRLKGTGPFAGMDEAIMGVISLILAAGFVLLVLAGRIRRIAAWRSAEAASRQSSTAS